MVKTIKVMLSSVYKFSGIEVVRDYRLIAGTCPSTRTTNDRLNKITSGIPLFVTSALSWFNRHIKKINIEK